METGLWITALLSAAAAIALGILVAQRPPTKLDRAGGLLRGAALEGAVFFTALGRWPVLAGLGALAFGVAMTLGTGLTDVAILLATQTLSQAASTLMKLGYHRPRPPGWLRIRETDLSYPSGHALSALVFFVGFAVLAWHAPLARPAGTVLAGLLVACALGIVWSRLALDAHYLTDVIGGVLFGTAFLCTALALIVHVVPQVSAA